VIIVGCGAHDGGVDAPTSACNPNPCVRPHETACSVVGAQAVCACDPGFVTAADGCTLPPGAPTAADVRQWVIAYKAAHPGNGGKDWDINAKTEAEIVADPDTQRLVDLCGDRTVVRPVIPLLAWEYGGGDHPWIQPDGSPLVICDYIPVATSTSHWMFAANHVTADTWLLFPADNPCNASSGADQIAGCIGDASNFEILVDTASLDDGADVGLALSEASTDLYYIPPTGGPPVHLYAGQ
jgi:hypothetical protein